MTPRECTLVCFALSAEARPFERRSQGYSSVEIRRTGIGRSNAERIVRRAFSELRPAQVLSCGFAGGLDPALSLGTVLYEADAMPAVTSGLIERFEAAGARHGRFHCADRIAATAAEKRRLRRDTGAEAVEMESGWIRAVCQGTGIPCLTVRAISDVAGEDLPLDFNALLGPDQVLRMRRLLWTLARSPRRIWPLLRLQRHSRVAAEALATVLANGLGLPEPAAVRRA